jgi:SHS2 domain-containing protein
MIQTHHRVHVRADELALELWAPTLAELCCEASRALPELVGECLARAEDDTAASRSVWISARGRAELLADWLTELLFLHELDDRVYNDARVIAVDDFSLHAQIRGGQRAPGGTAPRAAVRTCEVSEVGRGLRASVKLAR